MSAGTAPGAADSPDLSIVVVNWNTRDLLLSCLESLEKALAEVGPLKGEVIVVDNGSSDGSAGAVKDRFPWTTLVCLEHNVGYSRGMNEGLKRGRGRVLAMLNSDTLVTGGALRRCYDVLQSDPSIAGVGAQLVHPDGRSQNSVHAFPSVWTELLPIALLELALPRRFPSKRRPAAGPVDVEAVLGAALFVRREALRSVGLLSEEYFFFLEDTDWCWRARAAGQRIVHVPDARIEHWSGGSSKRRDRALTRIEFHRSLYRFLRCHRGRATLVLAVSLRLVKGISLVLGLGLLSFSPRARQRCGERAQLVAWHLRGCPDGPGVSQIDSSSVDGSRR